MAEKKSVMSMLTAMLGAVMNVVLNIILIPKMGPNGAAIATAISFITVFLARVITVSYTHLDVYKRQGLRSNMCYLVQHS